MNKESAVYDRRVLVQRGTIVPDAANDQVMEWADLFERWAGKQDLAPVQFVGAGQVVRNIDTAWLMRWDSESGLIAPENHRIIWRGVIYEIVGVGEASGGRMDARRFLCCSRPDQRGERQPIDGAS